MNSLARFAVKYPVTVLMLVLGIVLLGFISFGKLGTDLFPDLNNPKIYIELKAGEKPPEEIEKNYVDQIESLVMRQSDVVQVSSVTHAGSATITVEYDWNKDMDEAFLDLQKELSAFSQNSDLEDFSISQYDPNAEPVMIVGLKNPAITNLDDIRKISENYIRNELVRIEGVADLKLTGAEESEVVIETSKYMLESFGLTAEAIAAQISNYNRNVSGGSIIDMGLKYTVKGVSVLKDINDLENIIVGYKQESSDQTALPASLNNSAASSTSGKVPVYLRDVAEIKFANKDPENVVTINGERCVGLSIYKEPKYNTVDVVKNLEKSIAELQKALPGYEFIKVQDQGAYIDNAIGEVKSTLIIGILLSVLVLYVFLRRIGTTLVISIAIPVSIIATFNLMYFNHLSLNIMTLGGLALGAGMLVDNAIVVLENITRLREEGMPLKEAVIKGTGQVGAAITASTVTTVVVFLPIVYLHGASGEMFKDQAWTVAFALFSSLVVAMLVIPMLVSTLFKDKKKEAKAPPLQFVWYKGFLEKVVDKRIMVIILSIMVLGLTTLIVPRLGSEFMPKSESAEFSVEMTLPEGTSLLRTATTASKAESVIQELLGDKLLLIYCQSGSSDNSSLIRTGARGENIATFRIKLKDEFKAQTEQAITLISNYLNSVPGVEIAFRRDETALQASLGTSEAPFSLEISGEEYSEIERIVTESKGILTNNPDLYNLTTSMDEGTPEIEIAIDRFRSSYYNVSVESIINQLKGYLSGSSAGNFEKDGEMKDVTIRLGDLSLHQLNDLLITAGSVKIPLSELATVKTVISPREITRRNQSRTSYIYASVASGKALDRVIKNAKNTLSPVVLPVNYKMEFTGEELKRKESMSNLSFALVLSLVLVFMVLAAEFESVIQPFVIMLTIPMAGIGTVLTFFLLGKSLNMMAYIGIIMLGGIAVNNAILLIDRINKLREEGMPREEAILTAGSQRIRPILMTSLTTILTLVPLAIGIGESASLRAPMALAVIGGMISSTLLTLVVIPCFYWVFDDLSKWLSGERAKL